MQKNRKKGIPKKRLAVALGIMAASAAFMGLVVDSSSRDVAIHGHSSSLHEHPDGGTIPSDYYVEGRCSDQGEPLYHDGYLDPRGNDHCMVDLKSVYAMPDGRVITHVNKYSFSEGESKHIEGQMITNHPDGTVEYVPHKYNEDVPYGMHYFLKEVAGKYFKYPEPEATVVHNDGLWAAAGGAGAGAVALPWVLHVVELPGPDSNGESRKKGEPIKKNKR